jgi:uncharacterized protein
MTKPIVIFHDQCRDGWCAAWIIAGCYRGAELVPGQYGHSPPDVTGRDVILADFSYPRAEMEAIAAKAKTLTVYDHHKTAEAALRDLPGAMVHFDLERSGAGVAWDFLHPTLPRPWLVDYVEDRDLWRHRLPDSEEVNAYIATLPFEYRDWDGANTLTWQEARGKGAVALAKTQQYVREVAKNARRIVFEGHEVPIVNAPQVDISELLASMLETSDTPFVMGWWQRADGLFAHSLRSKGDFDVSELAKRHGGGGHKNAAGFQAKAPVALEQP